MKSGGDPPPVWVQVLANGVLALLAGGGSGLFVSDGAIERRIERVEERDLKRFEFLWKEAVGTFDGIEKRKHVEHVEIKRRLRVLEVKLGVVPSGFELPQLFEYDFRRVGQVGEFTPIACAVDANCVRADRLPDPLQVLPDPHVRPALIEVVKR